MRSRTTNFTIVSMIVVALTVSGCATTGPSHPLTTQEKIEGCVAMVGLLAIVGAATDKKSGKRGATRGAALGGAVCAAWLAFESQKDKENLAQAQRKAAKAGTPTSQSWTGEDGVARTVIVNPSEQISMIPMSSSLASTKTPAPTPAPAPVPQLCRKMNTKVTAGNDSDQLDEVWCLDGAGNWAPAATNMTSAFN